MEDSNVRSKRDKIIERVRKLSELAHHADHSEGGMQAEAKLAGEKMQELMKEYLITWADILSANEQEKIEFTSSDSDKMVAKRKPWHTQLSWAIAHITHTKNFFSGDIMRNEKGNIIRATVFCFFGLPDMAIVAAGLFDKWVVVLNEMARYETSVYCEKLLKEEGNVVLPKLSKKQLDMWKEGWLLGVCSGLNEKYKDGSNEQETALMIYDHALQEKYDAFSAGFKKTKDKLGIIGLEGYYKGKKDAEGININQKEISLSSKKKELSSPVLLLN